MAHSEKRNHYTTVKMAPCKICGGTSTGYHFGAITCEACKAFFRRAISKKSYSTYSCQRDDKCADNPKTIASCVSCRIKRCLDAGMSKEGIRRGRYSIALRTKSILEAKKVQSNPDVDTSSGTNLNEVLRNDGLPEPEISNSAKDAHQNQNIDESIPASYQNNHPPEESPPNDVLNNSPTYTAFPRTPEVSVTEKKYIEFIIDRLVTLQKMLYPHNEVTEDIVKCQKQIEEEHKYREDAFKCLFGSSNYLATASEFREVLQKASLELDDRLVFLRDKGRAAENNIALYIHNANFIPGFERLHQDDIHTLLKASYNEFWLFSNYASMNDYIQVSGGTDGVMNAHKKMTSALFSKDYTDSVFCYAKTLQRMKLSKEEIAIIRAIVLTFADRAILKQPGKVENLQMLFIRCLRYHLSKTLDQPYLRFYKIFDRLIAARNLTHKNGFVNRDFLRDWGFLMEEFPIWKAMMESTACR